ncbi:MAG: toll/interleukin-1 receptor domain-containing protein, partial [Acidobacteriota bacterium]|nr:toll/interleukin-1 receptor domain-containing protein [Acidobacteriota bacterium]
MNASTDHQMIFVSHANPEDNEFAKWLTLQLANEGYAVWCDQTKLLGGEKFWEDIQTAIKNHTAKFVFVLTEPANNKRGTLDELDCAIGTEKRKNLKDFIIPLKLDDLAYDDTYISIRRLNQIYFRKSWATGLAKLLE